MQLSIFPEKYKHICEYVKYVFIVDDEFEKIGNVDLLVGLRNDLVYSFTAFSVENISFLMSRDEMLSFVSPGMLVVNIISVESVLNALEDCLFLSFTGNISFDHFGIRQINQKTAESSN